jgi:hypothetical protein
MSFVISQATAFCKLHKCTFKIRYETCFDEFTAHIRKIIDEDTGGSLPLSFTWSKDVIGSVRIVIEHQKEISMSRGKTYDEALLMALGEARIALGIDLGVR